MARSVRISEEAARALDEHLERYGAARDTPLGRAGGEVRSALARLDRVPKSPAKPRKSRHVAFNDAMADLRARKAGVFASRKPSKSEKRDRRAAIRAKVFERAEVNGIPMCEGPRWTIVLGPGPSLRSIYGRCDRLATELAHAFGKGSGRMPESERNCTAYCHSCAVAETNNRPDGEFWWRFRAAFFREHGFTAEAREALKRAVFVEARAALPAAPRVRHD